MKIDEKGNLSLGTPTHPTGITIYDKDTNQPYCIEIKSGKIISTPGECN
ncbi:MAG: hypothetical protein J7K33_03485 [Candidatus Marinimicrobia bacterium]|nr:hypothetical protein [Candidatus Neomarinimicrobiota bacterium]